MGMTVEEVIQGAGFLPNGAIVPVRGRPKAQPGYQTFEQLVEHAEALGCGPVYYNRREGEWVRVAWRNTGETRHQGDAAEAAGYPYERRVCLTLKEARETGADYLHHTAGWLRGGAKREREHPENVGDTAMIPVQWVPVVNASPSPQGVSVTDMTSRKRTRRVSKEEARAHVERELAAVESAGAGAGMEDN